MSVLAAVRGGFKRGGTMKIFIILGFLTVVFGCFTFFPPVFEKVFRFWYGRKGPQLREKYRSIEVRSSPENTMRRELYARLRMMWLLLFIGFLAGLLFSLFDGGGEILEALERPTFGEGESRVELIAEHGGQSDLVQLTIREQSPASEELERFFASASEAALKQVLGDNEDFSHVTRKLNLITGMDGGIEIKWQVSDPGVISVSGVIGENIPMEGAGVEIVMNMTYGGFSRSFKIPVTVWPDENAEDGRSALTAYINDAIAEDPEAPQAALPKEYKDSALILRRKEHTTGQNLALLFLIAALLMAIRAGSRLEEAFAKRNRSLEEDYPDIVSRLAILFSAGLTIPAAWERLAADYERELTKNKSIRYGYEELRLTALELANTGYSDRVFYDFGKRCGSGRYMRLADILDQNMRKGTMQLTVFMEQEAAQAFELRKLQAAKTGEEAGAKLLLPMMMMFGLVIAMVVVPAWSGMKL